MNILKTLFGGGSPSDDRGVYFYVQPKMCKEILRIRVDPLNDLSRTDDGKSYWCRKVASAARCPFQAELEIYFDKNKRYVSSEVTDGTLVSEVDWLAGQGESGEIRKRSAGVSSFRVVR